MQGPVCSKYWRFSCVSLIFVVSKLHPKTSKYYDRNGHRYPNTGPHPNYDVFRETAIDRSCS